MQFKLRKLPKTKVASLESFPLETAEPYRPLPAPIYVLLTRNEKLVSVRGPFDFLTPRDLVKMKAGGAYYYGPILGRVEPFLVAAREVRRMLGWSQPNATRVLEPAPFEISDAILRKLSSLWGNVPGKSSSNESVIGIESYFAVAFTNELCDPIPADRLETAREKDPDLYETALLRAGVFVFLALHLGHMDLKLLNEFRFRFFSELIQVTGMSDFVPISSELSELKKWTENLIPSPEIFLISSDQFQHSISRVSQKLRSRLLRVRTQLIDRDAVMANTHDDGGLGSSRPDDDESEVDDVG